MGKDLCLVLKKRSWLQLAVEITLICVAFYFASEYIPKIWNAATGWLDKSIWQPVSSSIAGMYETFLNSDMNVQMGFVVMCAMALGFLFLLFLNLCGFRKLSSLVSFLKDERHELALEYKKAENETRMAKSEKEEYQRSKKQLMEKEKNLKEHEKELSKLLAAKDDEIIKTNLEAQNAMKELKAKLEKAEKSEHEARKEIGKLNMEIANLKEGGNS